MKKVGFPQPNGTIPYEVKKSDTLVSIAAQCDIGVGLLKKINRLMSEYIFCGQVLYVPGPDYVYSNFTAPRSPTEYSPSDKKSSAPDAVKIPTKPRPPDGNSLSCELSTSPIKSIPGHAERQSVPVTESVTLPRALSEEEVKKIDEECHQRFVKMDTKYIEPGDEEVPGVLLVTPDTLLFDADDSHPLVSQNGRDPYQFVTSILNITLVTVYHGTTTLKFERCQGDETDVNIQSDDNVSNDLNASNQETPSHVPTADDPKINSLRTETPLTNSKLNDLYATTPLEDFDVKTSKEEIEVESTLCSRIAEEGIDKISDAELILNEDGRQIDDSSKHGDGPVSEIAVRLACDKLTSSKDVETERVAETENKDVVTGQNSAAKDNKKTVVSSDAAERRHSSEGTSYSQRHSTNKLFSPGKGKRASSVDLETPITVFLCVKVDRSIEAIKGFHGESPPTPSVRGPIKSEYWYIIPCDKANILYAFFAHWAAEDGTKGFVVTETDSAVDYKKYNTVDGQKLVCEIIKDWELWSSVEYQRMKSEEEIKRLPLPELSESSSILGTSHIAVLICHLPAIAEGSPWKLVYSTSNHGFSLNTLYRKMNNVDSPVFLVVQDVNDQVFGALISCALKMSEHFYGSGESYLFTFYPEFKKFGWTGLNSFFVKGNKDSLAVGAGKGSNGLWFDGNLYHGRTQRCQTFENELLTISQDFTIKCLETWCFV